MFSFSGTQSFLDERDLMDFFKKKVPHKGDYKHFKYVSISVNHLLLEII